MFKVGDIVFFKSEHRSIDLPGDISDGYYHKVGVPYEVYYTSRSAHGLGSDTAYIKNLEDDSRHFAFGELMGKLISLEEWREIQLNNLLNNEENIL